MQFFRGMKPVILLIVAELSWAISTKSDYSCSYNKELTSGYFIYNLIVKTSIFYCFQKNDNVTRRYCKDNNLNTKVNDKDIVDRCVTFLSATKSDVRLCEETEARIDIKRNTITSLSSNLCYYGKGECYDVKFSLKQKTYVLWKTRSNCSVMEKVDYRHLGIWNITKNNSLVAVDQHDNSYTIALLKKEHFCNLDFWKTDQRGIFISAGNNTNATLGNSRMSEYSVHWKNNSNSWISLCDWKIPTPTVEIIDLNIEDDSVLNHIKIAQLQKQLNCLTIFVIICMILTLAMWQCGCSANFMSIKKESVNRPTESKMNVLRCLSESLTVQYLFRARIHTLPLSQELYESMENDYYEK